MKWSDINAKLTEKVTEYIQNGYFINIKSMGGSQGEIGKVDLVKGEELIRVWIVKDWRVNDSRWKGSMLMLRVGRWTKPASYSERELTVWYGDIEIISEDIFYEISQDKWYTDDLEEALKVQGLQHSRLCTRLRTTPLPETTRAQKEIGVKYLKRKAGYKRVRTEDIKVQKLEHGYRLTYSGNNYTVR